MKIIKTKLFTKWAIKNEVSDEALTAAAKEIAIDAYEANKGRGKREEGRAEVQEQLLLLKKADIVSLFLDLRKMLKVIFLRMRNEPLK